MKVFDWSKTQEIPLYQSYNNKIEVEGGRKSSQSCIYPFSRFKLLKMKDYIEEKLKKIFIFPITALCALPVSFV